MAEGRPRRSIDVFADDKFGHSVVVPKNDAIHITLVLGVWSAGSTKAAVPLEPAAMVLHVSIVFDK
jgi:hypothetical protein